MAYLTVGGFGCVRGRVTLPRLGVWVADVVIEPTSAPGSPPGAGQQATVVLNNALALVGTVRRAAAAFGVVMARIVGGGGGFPTQLVPKAYQGPVPLSMPLKDLLTEAGEQLSTQSDGTTLGVSLPYWVRAQAFAFEALELLTQEVPGTAWRVQPDGTTWVGPETWRPSGMPYSRLAYSPQELKMIVYSDRPTLLPGQTLGGGHVSAVEHVVDPEKIRTEVLFEDPMLLALENT